ncbi:mechanosensitive ion channel [Nitzschia inconspicua]|uniref:Mechanosensitive ion channel n=1 Tax=Nitzschia inconspicua TaxID=303405 RepID=A0A9K3LD30_9STRA|nr:mechanosensitive ion channel [Nitzschia inconspicua]
METANKANPLHFIPKPPSSAESENPSQPGKIFWNIGQSRRHRLPPPSLKRDSTSGSKSYTEKALVLQRQKSHAIRSLEHARHRRAKTLLTSLEGSISRRGGDYFGIAAEDDHFREFDKIYDDNIASNTVSGEDDDQEDDDGKSTGDTETGTEEYSDEELAGPEERQLKKIREFLNPLRMLKDLGRGIMHSTLFVSLIFFTIAWLLYYYCGNPPPPDFLPGTARLSWWCNFADSCLTSLGLCLRYIAFKNSIYQSANSGSWILDSENYLRILLSMLVAGILAALKRTIVSRYFGRRMVDMYRQRLDEILNEIIMISEIAELSVESESIVNVLGVKSQDDNDEESLNKEVETQSLIKPRISAVRWSEVKFNHDEDMSRIGLGNDLTERDIEKIELEGQTYSEAPRWNRDDEEAKGGKTGFYDSSSGFPTMDLLDKWNDPVKKRDKSYDASVNDILKFRKALTYMNLDFPFSEAFGRASTRKEMVRSSEVVYSRLQKLAPGKDFLPCSVFQILYLNKDGTEDKARKRAFGNLLRPDFHNNIQLLSFVQSCDTVYKKLRYFRASVGNSSVIDHVLENIIDGVFYFALGLIVLDLLNMNPWPLLVSTSTLIVAGSFAVGPSCAKAVEGILLIVGRRPCDIGDRILITDSPGSEIPSMTKSWIVEDISLFSTTLRFGSSNEIATISNGSVASARITNCARSKNAIAHCMLKFHISCQKDPDTMIDYRKGIESYIRETTHIWENIFFFRCEDVDTDSECVTFHLAVRSRYTWQVSNRVLQCQGELHQFCVSLAYKHHIHFDSPNPRSVTYYGGSLVDGGINKYKANILERKNIRNESKIIAGVLPADMARQLSGESSGVSNSEMVHASPLAALATRNLAHRKSQGRSELREKEAAECSEKVTGRIEDASALNESAAPAANAPAVGRSSDNDRFLSMLQDSHP